MTKSTINGVTYTTKPDTDGCYGCKGCVANDDTLLCDQLLNTNDQENYCAIHEVVWCLPQTNQQ